MRSALGAIALTVACAGPVGCASPPPPPAVQPVTQIEWTVARARLVALRAHAPRAPWAERVRVSAFDPRTRRHFQGRGALAVDPGRAARMILLGPGGATAMDLWVTPSSFRFAVPALARVMRGGTDPRASKGLPVDMLRWWFLSPLEGRLLYARASSRETSWVLRAGEATVTVRTDGQRFAALRRANGRAESIEWLGRGLEPRTGTRGVYRDATGLEVEVVVEEVMTDPPEADAFVDPDRAEVAAR